MPLDKYFETAVYWNDLAFDRNGLLALIDDQGVETPQAWSQRCLTSFFLDRKLYLNPRMRPFCEAVTDEMYEYCKLLDVDLDRYVIGIREMWVNRYLRGHGQESHIHPGSQISGIYYLEADSRSAFTAFQSPLEDKEMMPLPVRSPSDTVRYAAVPGRVVLFRSWLRHLVATHDGEARRTTIAWNAILVPKEAL